MKEDNKSLGRRFSDLLEENVLDLLENEQVLELKLEDIKPNTDQPRSVFEESTLNDLAASIHEHGVMQPIIVKPIGSGYMLVAGERRVRAAKIAGLETIPAIVRDYNQKHIPELALIENLQRADLTPIEEAIAFQTILKRLDITHAELAKKIGKSRVYVTNIVGLLHLPLTVIESVNHGILTMGHARALSKLRDQSLILKLHERIIKDKLTVRELESIIRNSTKKHRSSISNATVEHAKKRLNKVLSDSIKYKLSKTHLTFRFDNEEELNQLLKLLKGEGE